MIWCCEIWIYLHTVIDLANGKINNSFKGAKLDGTTFLKPTKVDSGKGILPNYYWLIEFNINKGMVISYDRSEVYWGGSGVIRIRAESQLKSQLPLKSSEVMGKGPTYGFFVTSRIKTI